MVAGSAAEVVEGFEGSGSVVGELEVEEVT